MAGCLIALPLALAVALPAAGTAGTIGSNGTAEAAAPPGGTDAAPATQSWPVRFSESYQVGARETLQLPLVWDDLKARRFRLVLEAPREFDALLTRDRDASILFSGRRARRYEEVIPWGRDETAHLALTAPRDQAVVITLRLSTDPAEAGLAIYRFQVNRFLQLYAEGDSSRAVAALAAARQEDPADSVAALLWRSAWQHAGLTVEPMTVRDDDQERALWRTIAEGRQIEGLRRRVEAALAAGQADSARAFLGAAEDLKTPRARAASQVLLSTVAMAQSDWGTAIGALHEALRAASAPEATDQRFEVYRLLVRAYRAFGDSAQAAATIERAVAEAPDAAARIEAESWRGEHRP